MLFKKLLIMLPLLLVMPGVCQAQFLDNFDKNKIEGWFFFTGDGAATMDFVQKDGYSSIRIDATKDRDNVYWTLIKRNISSDIDLEKLKEPGYELRVEAKVRLHDAPRRLNFMLNTNRTVDFHQHLMEYDIPDTTDWHIISYTTKNFDAVPGDSVYVQLCATDYGPGKYDVDVDYYRADVVNVNDVEPDLGVLVPYHPPIPEVSAFSTHLNVEHDCVINTDFHDVNFNNWHIKGADGEDRVLTVNADQWAILRWDFSEYKDSEIKEASLLELTTQSVAEGGDYIGAYDEDFGIEFGKIRVIEIFGGDSSWDQQKVTYDNFMQGKKYSEVFNSQMTYDADLKSEPGGKNYMTISKPVMQRLISGKTKGLLIRPLGAIDASFYASEDKSGDGPVLHFNLVK